jgi:putative membrane protein
MFSLLARLIFSFFSNLVALMATVYLVSGFEIAPGYLNFLTVAGIFTLINVFIRPIIKIILSPVIILTFGFGIFIVNALMLYLLDFLSESINITNTASLIFATLIIGAVNILIAFSAKGLYKNNE